METTGWNNARQIGPFLLDSAIALLRSGASSDRIRINTERLAAVCEHSLQLAISPLAIVLTLTDKAGHVLYNGTATIAAQGVNFQVISGISHLSWDVIEGKTGANEAKEQLKQILAKPHFNRWLLLLAVSLAGSGFCFTFGGGAGEMAIGFFATFFGLFCKQELVKHAYNTYIITYVSAVTAGVFVGILHLVFPQLIMEHAFSTCVLFLIPGVPLINAITDLIEGYTLNGVARGVSALLHALAIASGLVTVLFLFKIV
jgi:uncharacterized membrane protein YjjP (DUF1212 family)